MAAKSPAMRIVVLGSGAVGKSSLTVRLTTGKFFEDYDPTIEDCHVKTLIVDGQAVLLEILDTAGQGDYHSTFLDQWIESAQGFLLVYSIDSSLSLENLFSVRDRILLSKDDEKVPIVLVGNKCDVDDKRRQVTTDDGQSVASRWGCAFWESSAKESTNLNEPFMQLVRDIRKRAEEKSNPNPRETNSWKAFWRSICTIL